MPLKEAECAQQRAVDCVDHRLQYHIKWYALGKSTSGYTV
jgi:cytochrome oxidase assembly protein ShyY1